MKNSEIFKVLSVESRLELFVTLNNCHCGEESTNTCMGDLSKILDMSLPNVQRNIRSLEEAGLVEVNKVSRTCYCRLTKLGKKVFNFLDSIDE